MDSAGKLVLTLSGGQEQEFALTRGTVTLGRGALNDVVLRDAKVSRSHAQLQWGETGYTLLDLGSANGTHLNGVRTERAVLAPGDVIRLGDTTLRFEITLPRIEPDATVVDSEAGLEATLAEESLSMTLTDTRLPRLAVYIPGKTWEVPLGQDVVAIGRHWSNDVVVDHEKVSRNHARVERRGDAFVIRDLGSTNGTWLGEQRIEEHILQDGQAIRIGHAQLVYKRAFEPEELTLLEAPRPGVAPPRRPVVIVPGLMGSELWRGSERLWPNVRLLFTNPELFRLPEEEPFEARGIVDEVVIVPNLVKQDQYKRLGDYLEEGLGYERGDDLLEFAYDWRQDVRAAARRLAETVDGWPVTPPITIIAHSLGCLVSRYYVDHLGGRNKVGRLVLLGGPHAGAPQALTSLVLTPGLLPFGLLGERLRQVIVTFPSFYQILPTYACAFDQDGLPIDVLADDIWLPEAQRPLLHAARQFRHELGERCSVPCVSIMGYGLKTITRLAVQRDAGGQWQGAQFLSEPSGDGRIPEVSAVMPGSDVHPVQQVHGALYVDNDVKMRLKLELTRA